MVMNVKKRMNAENAKALEERKHLASKSGREKLMRKMSAAAAKGAKRTRNRRSLHKRGRQGSTDLEIWQQLGATAKLIVSYCQVLSQLEHSSGEPFPINFAEWCADFNVINLDIMQFFTFLSPCAFSAPFDTKFYGHMSIVPMFLIVLVLSWRTVHLFKICCKKKVKFTKTSAKMNATRILTGVIFVMYPGLSVKCFRVFNCIEINGSSYLMADLSVSCDDASYKQLHLVAVASITVYVLGVPFVGGLVLSRWKTWLVAEEDMSDDMHSAMMKHPELRETHHRLVQQFGSLFLSYRPAVWWYEFLEMLRKAMMTGMLTALPRGIFRNAVAVVVCVLYLGICASNHPYRLKTDYYLQLSLLFMLFATFYSNLLISGQAFKRKHEKEFLGDVLIAGNCFVMIGGGKY